MRLFDCSVFRAKSTLESSYPNNAGIAHENGDVEQSHFRFKEALDQALRVRGSREFSSRAAYERFVQDLARNRNLTRAKRLQQEQAALRPLPRLPLAPCRECAHQREPFQHD